MRTYFRTKTVSIPIPTEIEIYLFIGAFIMFTMWRIINE